MIERFDPAVHSTAQVARLIFETDPLLMSLVLGDERRAVPTIEKLVRAEHNEYASHRIMCAVLDGELAGILIGLTGAEKRKAAREGGKEWAQALGPVGMLRAIRYGSMVARTSTADLPDEEYYVVALSVDSRFRRRGVASALMARVLEQSGSVVLDVNIANPGAIEFYESHGFTITQTMTVHHKGQAIGNHQMRQSPSESVEHDLATFLATHSGYGVPATVDALRAAEYGRLDATGQTYLDYTGGGLYGESQIRRHCELLFNNVLGNPHSHNPTSLAATALVEAARAAVCRYFNACSDEYEVVFTQNASGALKLVAESYPFGPGGTYLLSYDNHNSVNGIREFARTAGAQTIYVPVRHPDLRLDEELVTQHLTCEGTGAARLFAYPAQSNFSGVQHPLEWIDLAHEYGWDVILDAAAFVPTNRLDLSVIKPDFVPVSFYKLFGYPTGIGALIIRREMFSKLRRPWFAGGTITLASVQGEGWHRLAPGAAGFEDGTVDYLGLPAVTYGIEHVEAVGIDAIHDRVNALASWLLREMRERCHSNGAPLYRVFGPDEMDGRGSTIAFYLLDPSGAVYDVYRVERLAGEQGISVRTGCFCNPGDGEVAHQITHDEMETCFTRDIPVTLEDCQVIIEDATGKVPNTIRVSLGIASTFEDVHRFAQFASSFRDISASSVQWSSD